MHTISPRALQDLAAGTLEQPQDAGPTESTRTASTFVKPLKPKSREEIDRIMAEVNRIRATWPEEEWEEWDRKIRDLGAEF